MRGSIWMQNAMTHPKPKGPTIMRDSPRYRIITLGIHTVEADLRRALRPGDRVVSIYPTSSGAGNYMFLSALLELRHPSWEEEGIGFVAGEETLDDIQG